jgi:hypothetical protein
MPECRNAGGGGNPEPDVRGDDSFKRRKLAERFSDL